MKRNWSYGIFAKELFRFLIIGSLNTMVGLGLIYSLMYFAKFDYRFANLLVYSLGIFISFFFNKNWTFQYGGDWKKALLCWLVVCLVAYSFNLSVVVIFHIYLGIPIYLSQLLGVIVYAGIVFFGAKFFSFSDNV